MVKTYGRNWKFMADSFLEMRAPLALKNRHSLLMRRLNRLSNGPQKAGCGNSPRHAASSGPSSGAATPTSPNGAVDLTSFFEGGRGPHGQHLDYAATNAVSNNFPLTRGPFGAGMMPPGDGTASGQRGRGGGVTAPWTTTAPAAPTSWDNQESIWQPLSFLGGGAEPDGVDNEAEKMIMMSDNGTGSQRLPRSGGGSSAELSDGGNSGIVPAPEVEYSVTCQRGRVKTLMNHLVDAAMSESAEWTAEDDPVTVSLRLKV